MVLLHTQEYFKLHFPISLYNPTECITDEPDITISQVTRIMLFLVCVIAIIIEI